MKTKPYSFLSVLLITLSFAGGYLSLREIKLQKMGFNRMQAANLPVSNSKQADAGWADISVSSFLGEDGYHIRNHAGTYSSVNRKQNIRAIYADDGFEIVPRKEESQSWRLKLKLAGINKGGKDLPAMAAPDFKITGNTLHVAHEDYIMEYINDMNGTRQNFLIARKPEGEEALKVLLQPGGNLALKSVTAGSAAFGDAGGTQLYYQGLKAWDARGKVLPAAMKKENNMLAIIVEDDNAIYPVTVDPLATTPGQTLQGLQADDQMGYSVASAGDINNDGFGDMIVGAVTYENGESNEGAAFIYYGSATGLAAAPDLILESNRANLRFGYSLAAADFNNDGFSDLVIGVPQYTNGVGEAYEGAVYLYYGSSAGLTLVPTILEGNKADARLGTCVATGDLNGDGLPDIASGALNYNNAGALLNGQGGVYVFYGIPGGFNTTPVILTTGLQGGVTFGGSTTGVSIGNFNGDAYGDLAVGAAGYDEGVSNQGAVFVYLGSAAGIPSVHSNLFTSAQATAGLGSSVAFAGDLNKDGYDDIAAGAPYYSVSETREGAAFIYYGSATSSGSPQIVGSNIAGACMGYTVAGGGDLDGDGFDDLAIGAYNYKTGPDIRGGLFVFPGSSTGLQATPILTKQENAPNYNGSSLAVAGNIDGANGLHLAVGIPGYSGGIEANGSVALYSGEAGTLPILLNQFNAKLLHNGEVEITWDTYAEQMNSYFEVLRSVDGIHFISLGRRNGQLNAGSNTVYKFIDQSPEPGNNFYMLMQYDVNGAGKSLGIKRVKVGAANGGIEVFPNPTVDLVNISFSNEVYKKAELADLTGRVFSTQKPRANEILNFNLSGLARGVYLVRLYSYDGKIISKRIVKK